VTIIYQLCQIPHLGKLCYREGFHKMLTCTTTYLDGHAV